MSKNNSTIKGAADSITNAIYQRHLAGAEELFPGTINGNALPPEIHATLTEKAARVKALFENNGESR